VEHVRKTQRHVASQHGVTQPIRLVVMPVSSLKTIEGDVSAELPQRHCIVDTQKPAARRVNLVIAANFTRSARQFIVIIYASRQQSRLAPLARVSDERGAKTRQSHLAVGLENRPHYETLEIKQTHIFIAVAT